MAGSYFGNILRVTTFGESHGAGVGAVLDGFPAGMELTNEDIQEYLDRRKPGRNSISTPRKEDDLVEILSGTFEGKTTGTPIALLIRNNNQIIAISANMAFAITGAAEDLLPERRRRELQPEPLQRSF